MPQQRDEHRRVRPRTAQRAKQIARERSGRAFSARRSTAVAAALALLLLASCLVTDATAGTSRRADGPRADGKRAARVTAFSARHRSHASARTVKVDDHAHLTLRKAYGAVLLEEGSATGTLPGRTTVRLVERKHITATFTIHARGGSIVGRGGAALHSTGRFASFGGWLKVSHGTGLYKHAHGSGRLYGVIDRRRHTLTVTTTGTLHY